MQNNPKLNLAKLSEYPKDALIEEIIAADREISALIKILKSLDPIKQMSKGLITWMTSTLEEVFKNLKDRSVGKFTNGGGCM
ncbi:MAG: hypothetical protein RLN62_02680 [Rickettsiales bacterium]